MYIVVASMASIGERLSERELPIRRPGREATIDIENQNQNRNPMHNNKGFQGNRIPTGFEDHTTRDSITVARLAQDISRLYGFDAHNSKSESACSCICKWIISLCPCICNCITSCCHEMKKVKDDDQMKKDDDPVKEVMPKFWKTILSNEDYDLIYWLKVTGFPFHEGGSYQPEDFGSVKNVNRTNNNESNTSESNISESNMSDSDKNKLINSIIDKKLIAYTNFAVNLMIGVKLILFMVFGFIGLLAWIGIICYEARIFFSAFFSRTIEVKPLCTFIITGKGFVFFISPIVQLFSIVWTMRRVVSELNCNGSIQKYTAHLEVFTDKTYVPCKKDSFNFFYNLMTTLIILLSWPLLIHSVQNDSPVKNSAIKYLLRVSFYYFFTLNVVQYLALSMFFISVSLKEVQKNQLDLLNGLDREVHYDLDNHDDVFSSFFSLLERVMDTIKSASPDYISKCLELAEYFSTSCVSKGVISTFSEFLDGFGLKTCIVSLYERRNGYVFGTLSLIFFGAVYHIMWIAFTLVTTGLVLVLVVVLTALGAITLAILLIIEIFKLFACCCLKVELRIVSHRGDLSKVTFVEEKLTATPENTFLREMMELMTRDPKSFQLKVTFVKESNSSNEFNIKDFLRDIRERYLDIDNLCDEGNYTFFRRYDRKDFLNEVKEKQLDINNLHRASNYKFFYINGIKSALFELETVYNFCGKEFKFHKRDVQWDSVQELYSDLYNDYSNERKIDEEFPVMERKLNITLTLKSYQDLSKRTLDIIERRKFSTDLILLTSLMNIVGVIFLIWLDTIHLNEGASIKLSVLVPQFPALLKEVVVFLYIFQKGTLINTTFDDFTKELTATILELSHKLPHEEVRIANYNINKSASEVRQELEVILAHTTRNPINFVFLFYRITRENWLVFLYSFLVAGISYVLFLHNKFIKPSSSQYENFISTDDASKIFTC